MNDFRVSGKAAWNKFLLVVSLEPTDAPTGKWSGADRDARHVTKRHDAHPRRPRPIPSGALREVRFLIVKIVLSVVSLALCATVWAQHEHHNMSGGDPKAWRMPPHDYPMPPLPGIADAVPIVGPFLARMDADDLSQFPEAKPGEIVEMADGEKLVMSASIVRRTINDKTFLMYGYNGQYPGPLIKAERGATVIVELVNEIEMPTTVHWHGLRLDNRFDGVPDVTQPAVKPGERFTYEVHFPDTGIYWYHPHVREDIQQDLGLYGNMLVTPPEADYYNPVNKERALILDDILMDDLGPFPWGDRAATHALMGRFGNVMLVNGAPGYELSVERGEVVRFYLTNVANARTFNVVFGGASVKVVGSDVSKYEREEWVESVVLGPAERYIVEVLFDEPGDSEIVNSIQANRRLQGRVPPAYGFAGDGARRRDACRRGATRKSLASSASTKT